MNTGLASLYVYSLAIDPANPATLYAGTYDSGIFKSGDAGATWTAVNTGLTDLHMGTPLAIDPAIRRRSMPPAAPGSGRR